MTSDRTRRGRSSAATTSAVLSNRRSASVQGAYDTSSTQPPRTTRALRGYPGRELLEQAGLPDADFPADEDERSGVGHPGQRLAERRERGLPPDEIRRPLASHHDAHCGRRAPMVPM